MRGGIPADIISRRRPKHEWFAQYQPFLEHYGATRSAIHAEVFGIGVELEKMSGKRIRPGANS